MLTESVNFDRAADYYDDTRGFPNEQIKNVVEFIRQQTQLKTTDKLLEIGIGTGRIALPIAPHVHEIHGVDISVQMMARLQQKQTTEAVFLTRANAEKLPFPDNSFDAIIIVHVLHLVPDAPAILRELQRVLKPKATLILGESKRDGLSDMVAAWQSMTIVQGRPGTTVAAEKILAAGWQPIGEQSILSYPIYSKPIEMLQIIERRSWSTTWTMDDDLFNRGVSEVKKVMEANYPDPTQPVEGTASFVLQTYKPPA